MAIRKRRWPRCGGSSDVSVTVPASFLPPWAAPRGSICGFRTGTHHTTGVTLPSGVPAYNGLFGQIGCLLRVWHGYRRALRYETRERPQMPAVLVVTTDGVPGYRITSVMGQVVGSVARLSNAFTEGIRTMDGQLNPRRSHDLAQWRIDAVNAMIEQARIKGANAVIGMRFDNRLISTAWAEICAYGTAVLVRPHEQPQPAAPAESGSPADG